jgi:nicotinate-nucleotide pyrophosphorylase (carboxylating)
MHAAVSAALDEDLGSRGDITSAAVVRPGTTVRGDVVAGEPLVVAGQVAAEAVFEELGQRAVGRAAWRASVEDGERAARGATVATVEGDARAVLAGERVALNLLQRLSGIATLTRACVEEVRGTGAVLLDTRKTTPGLRSLEKYAVLVGGGTNHRAGLHDRVLIKDNHVVLAGGVGAAVEAARRAGHSSDTIEVEVERPEQVDEAIAAGAGWILLDNMGPDALRAAVSRCAGRARLEASGGLRPGDLRRFAETGVDALSVGALTHSVRAVDLGLTLHTRDGQ